LSYDVRYWQLPASTVQGKQQKPPPGLLLGLQSNVSRGAAHESW
jgi:hypothetical protein